MLHGAGWLTHTSTVWRGAHELLDELDWVSLEPFRRAAIVQHHAHGGDALVAPTSLRARFRRDFDDHTGMICVSGRIVPAMALTGQLLRQRVGRRLFIVKAMEGWLTGSALVGVVPGVIFPGTF